jgi:hypothetical protein
MDGEYNLLETYSAEIYQATVWIYPPEILPLKIRAKGAALAAAADFLGNFLVVEVTPVGIANIGWRFYVVWAVLNLVNAAIVWLFYPETGGLLLEAVDQIFVGNEISEARPSSNLRGVRRLQWSKVAVAAGAVKKSKAERAKIASSDMGSEDGTVRKSDDIQRPTTEHIDSQSHISGL